MKKTQHTQASRKMAMLGLSLALSASAFGQTVVVKGNVVDETGEPLVGASVRVKGTNTGATTDANGNFTLNMKQGGALQVSYIGYNTQTVSVTGQNVSISLVPNDSMLDEAVVIGYGVQKKSVVTASIARVTAEDLEGKSHLRAEDALKGLAAGVNVTSVSGQPGQKSNIRVRGIGTINDSNPLYIIDGLATDQDGMELVNPADIESIEVLKDAASCAIYGARGANGVILITTKKGKLGKAQISYNGSYGWQSAWKHRDVTGATDYAILQNEKYINGGGSLSQLPYADPYDLTDMNGNAVKGFGTDWQDLVFNDNAPIQQHDVSVSGANELVNYYASVGYFSQDGIVGGNYGQSNYDRLTLRSNNIFHLFNREDSRIFLNKMDLGVNISYMHVNNTGFRDTNSSTAGTALGSALYLSPILPVSLTGAAGAALIGSFPNNELFRDENGDPYMIPSSIGGYNEMRNPIAMMLTTPQQNWSHKFIPRFNLDLQLVENLQFHMSYSAEMSFWGHEGSTRSLYVLHKNNIIDKTGAWAGKGQNYTWQLENTLTYDKKIGKHGFGVVLGQSALKFKGDELGGSRDYLINPNKPSINYATGTVELGRDEEGNVTGASAYFGVYGGPYAEHRVTSLFGRASYNYDERYMVQATVRRDGSSRFGTNNRFGIFPSVSLGWNVMNEAFMANTRSWLSNFKVRASWGKNGNDNIDNFAYTTLTTSGGISNYYLGSIGQINTGSKANRLANPDLKWEESEQYDLGLDFGFFNNALTFTADYFIKKTNGMIIEMPIASYVGEYAPLANVGDMKNTGVEFELGYKGHVRDFKYAIKGNASYLKNTLNHIGNDSGYIQWGIQQISGGGTRAEDGQPFPFFYGYKTDGVFQNYDEVNAYCYPDGTLIQPDARPGDLRFVDVDGVGGITENDRTNIGNGVPKWNYGVNLNLEWRGLDLGLFLQGVAGVKVFDATYRQDVLNGNFPTWILQRWTGEGTSNTVPKLIQGDTRNWQVSDLYIFDGSYARLKNITLGYTLPQRWTERATISRLRFYAMAENLMTFTKYHGFDPELGNNSPLAAGIDYGVYPQARTYTVGLQLTLDGGGHKAPDAAAAASYNPRTVERVVERVVEKPVEVVREVVREVPGAATTTTVQTTYVVTFPVNSSKIENTAELDGIAKGSTVEIAAYASPEGNPDANVALSQQRADSVAAYLKSRGVNVVRTTAKGADTNHANRIAIVTIK